MADDIIIPQNEQQVVQPTAPTISPEVAQMMEMSLNIGKPIANPYQTPRQQDPPPTTINNDTPETPATPDTPAAPVVADIFQPFKDKFGYQTPEDALKEIEELRALKANPQVPELQFENEDSKKYFNAALKGDRKVMLQILDKQDRLERLAALEVSKDTAPEIIKTLMALELGLEKEEVEFQYKQDYSVPKEPKEPVRRQTEEDDEFEERHNDWKDAHSDWQERVKGIEMKAIIAAKLAKPKLEAAKSNLVFPEIEDDTDEEYIQYRKGLEESTRLKAEVSVAYKTFKPEQIAVKVPYTDEQSKVNFEYQYVPDEESFNKTVEMVSDMEKFYGFFKDQEGKPDRRKFLEAIHFGLNKERIILEALKQSKNATIKASLPDNNSGGLQRQFPQRQELSEVDKLMQYSLSIK